MNTCHLSFYKKQTDTQMSTTILNLKKKYVLSYDNLSKGCLKPLNLKGIKDANNHFLNSSSLKIKHQFS